MMEKRSPASCAAASVLRGVGRIIDQPFQPRHAEGMVRCYLVQDQVAGFGHQLVTGLMDPPPGEAAPAARPPGIYYDPSKPQFQALKLQLESEWVWSGCSTSTRDRFPRSLAAVAC